MPSSALLGAPQGTAELLNDVDVAGGSCLGKSNDQDLLRGTDFALCSTEELSYEALDSIPNNRTPNFAACRDSEPTLSASSWRCDHHESLSRTTPANSLQPKELPTVADSIRLRESLVGTSAF